MDCDWFWFCLPFLILVLRRAGSSSLSNLLRLQPLHTRFFNVNYFHVVMGWIWQLDMAIGYGNWNGCHLGAAEMLRRCNAGAVAAALLLQLGARQGQGMYFVLYSVLRI